MVCHFWIRYEGIAKYHKLIWSPIDVDTSYASFLQSLYFPASANKPLHLSVPSASLFTVVYFKLSVCREGCCTLTRDIAQHQWLCPSSPYAFCVETHHAETCNELFDRQNKRWFRWSIKAFSLHRWSAVELLFHLIILCGFRWVSRVSRWYSRTLGLPANVTIHVLEHLQSLRS